MMDNLLKLCSDCAQHKADKETELTTKYEDKEDIMANTYTHHCHACGGYTLDIKVRNGVTFIE